MSVPQPPSPFLTEVIHLLPPGRVLDIAMGDGRNALYVARQGYEVEGLDINEQAIASCLAQAQKEGLRLSARTVDLETYQVEKEKYDLVMCFYYLQRSLIPQIKEALKAGGMVVYETFLIDNHLLFGHPRHREYCLAHNELLHLFQGFRILFYREGLVDEKLAVARLLAQKT